MIERDERAWLTVQDAAYRREGLYPFRFQKCAECGCDVLTTLTGDPPATCGEHS